MPTILNSPTSASLIAAALGIRDLDAIGPAEVEQICFAGARAALALFIVQLAVNALWSWLFFAWRLGGPAFAEVLLLWCLIAATAIAFRRISALAAVLLLPYLAWVTFASALTFAVWRLNPALLG